MGTFCRWQIISTDKSHLSWQPSTSSFSFSLHVQHPNSRPCYTAFVIAARFATTITSPPPPTYPPSLFPPGVRRTKASETKSVQPPRDRSARVAYHEGWYYKPPIFYCIPPSFSHPPSPSLLLPKHTYTHA